MYCWTTSGADYYNCLCFQTFRRLLLKQCEEEFNNRSKATQGNNTNYFSPFPM